MSKYFIKLSFDGAAYHGWQIQENANTVQAEIEKALAILFSGKTEVTGAGRTDKGVHAKEYYAHFDKEEKFRAEDLADIAYRINAILPKDIAIQGIFPVKDDAHARFSACSRTYRYYISRVKSPFHENNAWTVFGKINLQLMNQAAKILVDYTDFTSFSKLHTEVKTNNCKVLQADWKAENDLLVFTIKADRFLRNMVRAIVGTLADVGKEKLSPDDFRKVIESRNRCEAGFSVPAKGLSLQEIEYPESIFL